jgi:hypothetical protein
MNRKEVEDYFTSGEWVAKRAANAGMAFSEFLKMAKKEADKFKLYFPHPFKAAHKKRVRAYHAHLLTVFTRTRQGAAS